MGATIRGRDSHQIHCSATEMIDRNPLGLPWRRHGGRVILLEESCAHGQDDGNRNRALNLNLADPNHF